MVILNIKKVFFLYFIDLLNLYIFFNYFQKGNVNMKECDCTNDSGNEGIVDTILGTSNEKRMNLEKKSVINEPAANVVADGDDSDDGCFTNTRGYTTTAYVSSTTQTTTVTTTTERTVFSEAPTFTTTTVASTTVAYRPTNDITNGSGHASNISKLTFIVLAFVAMLFI